MAHSLRSCDGRVGVAELNAHQLLFENRSVGNWTQSRPKAPRWTIELEERIFRRSRMATTAELVQLQTLISLSARGRRRNRLFATGAAIKANAERNSETKMRRRDVIKFQFYAVVHSERVRSDKSAYFTFNFPAQRCVCSARNSQLIHFPLK